MLERLLEYLTAEELAEFTGVYALEKVEPHTLIQVVEAGLADPQLRNLVIDMVMRYVDLGEYERKYRVTEEDLKKFEEHLRRNRRKKTVQDRLYYLRVALRNNQFVLDASKLDDSIMEKAEESIDKAIHIARALKLFLKVVVRVNRSYPPLSTSKYLMSSLTRVVLPTRRGPRMVIIPYLPGSEILRK